MRDDLARFSPKEPRHVCFQLRDTGACTRTKCRFDHDLARIEAARVERSLEVDGDSENKAWDRGCCGHDVCAGGQDGGCRADRGEQQDDGGIGFGIGLVVYAARPGGKENQGFASSRRAF